MRQAKGISRIGKIAKTQAAVNEGGYRDVIVSDFAFEARRAPHWHNFRAEVVRAAGIWFGDNFMGVNVCQERCHGVAVGASLHLHVFVRPSITNNGVWLCVQQCAREHLGRLDKGGLPAYRSGWTPEQISTYAATGQEPMDPYPSVSREVLPARRPTKLPQGVVIGNMAKGASLTINISRPSKPARPKAPGRRPYGELTRARSVISALPKSAIITVATIAACIAIVVTPPSWPAIGAMIGILLWRLCPRPRRPRDP